MSMRSLQFKTSRGGMVAVAMIHAVLGGSAFAATSAFSEGEFATDIASAGYPFIETDGEAGGLQLDSAGGCEGEWLPGFSVPGVNGTIYAATIWDSDGAGPRRAVIVAGGWFTTAGGVLASRIALWDGNTWQPLGTGMNGDIGDLVAWDPDGVGPLQAQLVACGQFSIAGGTPANFIARWDGSTWRSFASGMNANVHALVTWDPDGTGPLAAQLVAGGAFTTAGGVPVNRIARWDGSTWHPFGGGMNNPISALTTWDLDGIGPSAAQLVAGGAFTNAGGVPVNRIARWDGSAWHPLGGGMNNPIDALTTWDPDGTGAEAPQLIAGGSFTTADDLTVNCIARWNGRGWQPLGTGMDAMYYPSVSALTTWDPDGVGPQPAQLVAGGTFATADGVSVNNIALWNGAVWLPIAEGTQHSVFALTTWDPDEAGAQPLQLVAGGSIGSVSGMMMGAITRWNGSAWFPFGRGMNDSISELITWDPDGSGPQPDQLVAAGAFTSAGGAMANRIARWNGRVWLPFGTGMDGSSYPYVIALTTWDPDGVGEQPVTLVAGGSFTIAGGIRSNNIARWDGSAWQTLGMGMNGSVYALTTWDPDGVGPHSTQLIAGGDFSTAGVLQAGRIAGWDGTAWHNFRAGLNGSVYALTTWDQDGAGPQSCQLVVGGSFTAADETPANAIARWDGSNWLSFGIGMGGSTTTFVSALTTWDPDQTDSPMGDVVAGGSFSIAGGVPANRIARWDGNAWHSLGTGLNSIVRVVEKWDIDGAGPAPVQLVVGGRFTTAGGVSAHRIARWDGSYWQPLGTGLDGFIDPSVYAITFWDVRGYGAQTHYAVVGGKFNTAGGQSSGFIAFWGCPDGVPCLRGDANGDDVIDFRDIDCFVSALVGEAAWLGCVAGLDAATYLCANDCNCNGGVDPDDIDCFVQCLVAGDCPPCP